MAQSYTYEQLLKMGATPAPAPTPAPAKTGSRSYTLEELQAMGAKPTATPATPGFVIKKKTANQALVDEVNKGPLASASKVFSSTGKFAGGAAINVGNAIAVHTDDYKNAEKANQDLADSDLRAIQEARRLAKIGETEKATRLLKIVQSHGTPVAFDDILADSQQNNLKQIGGAAAGTFLEQAAFAKGTGLPVSVTNKVKNATSVVTKAPLVTKVATKTAQVAERFPKSATLLRGGYEGSKYGVGFGASEALQEDNATLGGVVKGGFKGGLTGFATGAGTAGVILPFANLKNQLKKSNVVDELEQKYTDWMSGTTSGKKKVDKILSKTNDLNRAGTTGRTPQRTLAESGIIPERSGTKLDTFEQAKRFRETTAPLRKANRDALVEVGLSTAPTKLDTLESLALSNAKTSKNINSGRYGALEKDIKSRFAELRKSYPDGEVPLSVVDDIKSAHWDNVFGNKGLVEADRLAKDSDYVIAKALQKHIEDTASKAGATEVAQLNREIGDRLEAARYLEDLNGKTIKGGRLLKYMTTAIGSTLGQTIPGKIVGALGGNAVGEIIISRNVASPTKRLVLKNLQKEDPEAFLKTVEWLRKQKLDRETRLLLPAPAPGSSGQPFVLQPTINLPADINAYNMGTNELKNTKFGVQDSVPSRPVAVPPEEAIPRQQFVKQFGLKKRFFASKTGKGR